MSHQVIALIGNPNSGKTTLFNSLTGAHQRVGNWPGVTVEQKVGHFQLAGQTVELVDLPGIYSLEQEYMGLDEQIARDYLQDEAVDVILNIVDASNLERNLVLTQQLIDLGKPVLVALNMLDVARQQGIFIDAGALERRLGVPVVPVVASRGTGLDELVARLAKEARVGNHSTGISADSSASERIVARYHRSRELTDGVVEVEAAGDNLSEALDQWMLNRYLGIPVFLLMMYLMFTFAVNVGAVFIDFFDILFGAVFVDGTRFLLEGLDIPEWIIVLVADGLGGGIQLVATFIPVIGFLFLALSVLEDSGYMSRAAFVVDRLMAGIGLPGSAFVPLIVGFGCNVPAVMASRTLGRNSDRLLTIAMAPFMSCGARLTVYALFAAALFPVNGSNIVFLLYLLGITMAVATGWIFRRQMFPAEVTPSFQEMPAYHLPVLRNILITTWYRLRGFVLRAGKTIVLVVVALSFFNSFSFDGSFGNEDSENSVLATVGQQITPLFAPIGLQQDNWPATVGLFTGLFAKEAVVGTLDALYSDVPAPEGAPDVAQAVSEAVMSILDNGAALGGLLFDPLGLSALSAETDVRSAAESQGVETSTLTNMAAAFGSPFAAFCYLVFVLLYAPCVAVMGTIAKEAGWRYMMLVFSWTTTVAYVTACIVYQSSQLLVNPLSATAWIVGCLLVISIFVFQLKQLGRRIVPQSDNLIQVMQVS